ncbi:MAG: archease [Candidatus Woesearchaeota archaeon]
MSYKIIKGLTSDVVFEVNSKTIQELFIDSAKALFSIICEIDMIKQTKKTNVELKSDNLEELYINWLNYLIALVDIEEKFYSDFKIVSINENNLKAICYGDDFKIELGKTVVKAVTYYDFEFKKTNKGFYAKVSLDI